jgi:hypothetical protein
VTPRSLSLSKWSPRPACVAGPDFSLPPLLGRFVLCEGSAGGSSSAGATTGAGAGVGAGGGSVVVDRMAGSTKAGSVCLHIHMSIPGDG